MVENSYYSKKLTALRLKRCYEIASPRIKQYLEAEIQYVLNHIQHDDIVLELGCGYGRVITRLAKRAKKVYGIDTSEESITLALETLDDLSNVELLNMNAIDLNFPDQMFDLVIAIQNSISAFNVDPHKLISESIRVTKSGGKVLLSSYSSKIWDARLDWFIKQSEEGLLGEIDLEKTGKGVIICKDGFKATTYTRADFFNLAKELRLKTTIEEIDESSVFCVIFVY
ncbi:MAG: class I SAM-dependent methyltransferase [Candidatus Heimdallarchaeota archaeon]|nr:MAG: class I SAM-dependent methyltransferase [Candidatus Heimdallarchaeota archaeon]